MSALWQLTNWDSQAVWLKPGKTFSIPFFRFQAHELQVLGSSTTAGMESGGSRTEVQMHVCWTPVQQTTFPVGGRLFPVPLNH